MAEWLIEQGIGEDRAITLHDGEIVAARLRWPGALVAGLVEDATLISRAAGSARGTARFANGEEALVSRLPASAAEGAPIRLEVTRAAMAEKGRYKRAQARPTDTAPRPAPSLADSLCAEGHTARIVHRFPACDWDDLLAEAISGDIAFPGGALLLCPTPAMLLVDVDGTLPPRELALAAVPPLAATLRRLDIGGSVGVDFPTLEAKQDRRAVDDALAESLWGWPHEKTAMNGFGFVQLVARAQRPSILQLASHRRAALAARQLLRRAEGLEGAGALELAFNPVLERELTPAMLAELARRTGRDVRLRSDPALAPEAGQAQLVPR